MASISSAMKRAAPPPRNPTAAPGRIYGQQAHVQQQQYMQQSRQMQQPPRAMPPQQHYPQAPTQAQMQQPPRVMPPQQHYSQAPTPIQTQTHAQMQQHTYAPAPTSVPTDIRQRYAPQASQYNQYQQPQQPQPAMTVEKAVTLLSLRVSTIEAQLLELVSQGTINGVVVNTATATGTTATGTTATLDFTPPTTQNAELQQSIDSLMSMFTDLNSQVQELQINGCPSVNSRVQQISAGLTTAYTEITNIKQQLTTQKTNLVKITTEQSKLNAQCIDSDRKIQELSNLVMQPTSLTQLIATVSTTETIEPATTTTMDNTTINNATIVTPPVTTTDADNTVLEISFDPSDGVIN